MESLCGIVLLILFTTIVYIGVEWILIPFKLNKIINELKELNKELKKI